MTSGIMHFTGERYVPQLKGPIYYEHAHRYAMAVPLVAGKDVLDIASGEGYGSVLLARHARCVYGVDVDAEAVAHARRAYDVPNAYFRVGSCESIPLPDDSVDVVVSFETLEHLTEHEAFVSEVRRVMRPGGIFLVSSPNKREYSDVPNFQNPYHLRELYFPDFRDFLTRSFKHVAIFGQRLSAISLVYALGSPSESSAWLTSSHRDVRSGLPEPARPLYFIGACSDEPLPDAVATSAFMDADDDLLAHYGPTPAPPIDQPEAIASTSLMLALPHGSAAQDGELAHLRSRVAELDDLSARAHGRIAELEAQLAERDEQLAAANAHVADAERRAEQAAADGAARLAEQAAQHQADAADLTARLERAEQRADALSAEHAAQAARWEDERTAWEAEKLANLRVLSEVRRLEGEAGRARSALSEAEQRAERERAARETQHADDQRQLEHLHALLNDVVTSHSWKLTKPLRQAVRTLRRRNP